MRWTGRHAGLPLPPRPTLAKSCITPVSWCLGGEKRAASFSRDIVVGSSFVWESGRRPQMLSEEIGDPLEVELVGLALERVRLAGILEVVHRFAGRLEPGQQ